jgi:hypothetical protein
MADWLLLSGGAASYLAYFESLDPFYSSGQRAFANGSIIQFMDDWLEQQPPLA